MFSTNSVPTSIQTVGPIFRPTPFSSFQSQSLDFGSLETRFLTIDPGPIELGSQTLLSCRLEIKSLFDCPSYTALSYSWGDHNSTCAILLDGGTKHITTSLQEALKELAARGTNVVWVDALCIDQTNAYEKVYQLNQMGTIFSKAAKVVAWLGPAADNSDNAMQALSDAHETDNDEEIWFLDDNLQESPEGYGDDDDVDPCAAAIDNLLKRTYWERVWIIQELAKASTAEVWCGSRMLGWDTFIRCVQRWWSDNILDNDFDHPVKTLQYFCDAERSSRKGKARMLLSAAIVRTIHTKATLRKDRIFALLGLARDGKETVPTPNYVQTDTQVFNSVFRHMIVEQGQIDIILLASLTKKDGTSPSWLPSWDGEMPLRIPPLLVACFKDLPDDSSPVHCKGDVLEVKGAMTGSLQADDEGLTSEPELETATSHWDYITDLLSALSVFCGRTQRNRYLIMEARSLALFWTSSPGETEARCPNLRQWCEKYADMAYGNTTLRSSLERLRKEMDLANGSNEFIWTLRSVWCHLERLDVSTAEMSRHAGKVQVLKSGQRLELVVVPSSARASDDVAEIARCSLPVVLRKVSKSRYCVVGAVVKSTTIRTDRGVEVLEQLVARAEPSTLPLGAGRENEARHTLHLV